MLEQGLQYEIITPDEPRSPGEMAAALAALVEGYGEAAYDQIVHVRRISEHRATVVYATEIASGHVVGCAYVTAEGRLSAISVLPTHTGRGIASAMIVRLRAQVWPMFVEVGQESPSLTQVLLRLGFSLVAHEKRARMILQDLGDVRLQWLGGGTYIRDRLEGPGKRTFQLFVGGEVALPLP